MIDEQRVELCRRAARFADYRALSRSPELREVYEGLAAQWRMLASEFERTSIRAHRDLETTTKTPPAPEPSSAGPT